MYDRILNTFRVCRACESDDAIPNAITSNRNAEMSCCESQAALIPTCTFYLLFFSSIAERLRNGAHTGPLFGIPTPAAL